MLGVGPLVRIVETVNANAYHNPEEHVTPSLEAFPNQPSIFVQDNAPCNTEKRAKNYFKQNIQVMKWPAQSPDLNPIGNL